MIPPSLYSRKSRLSRCWIARFLCYLMAKGDNESYQILYPPGYCRTARYDLRREVSQE